jgi:hypothetical protein
VGFPPRANKTRSARAGPGDHWQHVGTIDTVRERDLWKNVQVFLGLRRSAARNAGFYLQGIATHPWVIGSQEEDAAGQPFWLAIDPFGDGSRYLVTTKPAKSGTWHGDHQSRIPGYWSDLQPLGSGSGEPSMACSPTFAVRPPTLAKLERCVALHPTDEAATERAPTPQPR